MAKPLRRRERRCSPATRLLVELTRGQRGPAVEERTGEGEGDRERARRQDPRVLLAAVVGAPERRTDAPVPCSAPSSPSTGEAGSKARGERSRAAEGSEQSRHSRAHDAAVLTRFLVNKRNKAKERERERESRASRDRDWRTRTGGVAPPCSVKRQSGREGQRERGERGRYGLAGAQSGGPATMGATRAVRVGGN